MNSPSAATVTRFALPLVIAVLLLGGITVKPCLALDASGCWSGQWYSCKNGHHGPMTASLCRIDDKHYSATFRGRFWKIFPFRYRAVLTVTEDTPEYTKLSGSMYLGRLFGTFSYHSTVTKTCFDSNFRSCRDWGKFEMSRCCQ